jgi:hypothetical protein
MDEWLEYAVADVPKLFAQQPRAENESKWKTRVRTDRPQLVIRKRELADIGTCSTRASSGVSITQEQQPSLFDFTRRQGDVAISRNR